MSETLSALEAVQCSKRAIIREVGLDGGNEQDQAHLELIGDLKTVR